MDSLDQFLGKFGAAFLFLKTSVGVVLEDRYEARPGFIIGVCAAVDNEAPFDIVVDQEPVIDTLGVSCKAASLVACWTRSKDSGNRRYVGGCRTCERLLDDGKGGESGPV
jgi:hypothetical protein